jgi:PAS domain S-box-containing protein
MKRLFHSLSRTDDGAFVIDERHRIIFWNQAAKAILGYTAEEVAGLQCYEIMGGRDEQGRTLCQRFCRVATQAERGDVMPNRDVYVRTRSGEGCWLNVTTFAYASADQTIGQVIVHLFRDVTENKEYQQFVDHVLAASEQLQQNGKGSHKRVSTVAMRPQGSELTPREWQVLGLMAQGQGTGEMAVAMTVSTSTVRNHVQNILDKLGVHSRLGAIAYAYQNGLIESNGLRDHLGTSNESPK